MEDNDSSSDNSSYFADEESDEDNRRETTDLTSPVSFRPSISSSGFSFGCNYDIVEDEEGQNLSRRASLPTALPVERYAKACGAYRSQSLDRGAETRRPVAWLEDAEMVSEPQPILTRPGSLNLDLVEETRGTVGWKQNSEIVEEARYPANVELTHSQKENPADRSEPCRVVIEEKACRCVEHSDATQVLPLAIKDAPKSKSKPELKHHHFQRHDRQGFKTYIKTLFPIHQLLDALRKRVVVQSENVLYFPQLSNPIELSTSDYILNLELRYGRRKRQFVLVKTLDGLGGQHSRMFLATHNSRHHDASDFLVLKSFRKMDGPVRLDTTSPRLTLRRELRVFKRLATLKDNVRRFVVGSAGVLENEHAHYVIMVSLFITFRLLVVVQASLRQPAMYCDLLDVLLKKTKVKKNVFAKAWIAQLVRIIPSWPYFPRPSYKYF
jgi:hypothetical protein